MLKTTSPPPGVPVFSRRRPTPVRKMLQMAAGPAARARAQTVGYSVGGKSGHGAQAGRQGYATNKHRAWFTGMAPIDKPRIIVAVMIDEPSNGVYYGGAVAAPVFSEVVQQTLRMMGVQPDMEVKPPDRGRCRGGVVLMRPPPPHRIEPPMAARSVATGRCAPTAARCAPGRLHRPARRRHRWPRSSCAMPLRKPRRGLPGRARGRRAFGLDDARRHAAPAQGCHGDHRRRMVWCAQQRCEVVAHGTNGKTSSTAWWLAHALQNWHQALAHAAWWALWACGTVGPGGATGMTTPDPVRLQQRAFAEFVDAGARLRHRGLVHRHGRAPAGGAPIRVAICSPTSRRTTWTTTGMAAYWLAKRRCSTGLGCSGRGQHRRRRKGARPAAPRLSAGLDAWTCLDGVGPLRPQAQGDPRDTAAGLRFTVVEAIRCTRADAPDRR